MQTAAHPAAHSDEILRNLPRIDGIIPMYVDGGWRLAAEGGTRELYNPANGRAIVAVVEGTATDAQAAIAAARRAFDDGPWGSMNAADRATLLFRVADAIDAHRDEFMRIDTLNNGKPLRETEYDAVDAANCFRYYAGLATKPHGQTFDVPAPSQTFTVREPIGVCGQIVPWNYPLLMATWKLAPALAAGNVCVLKPAELTPLSVIRLAAIFEELQFPPGRREHRPGRGCHGRARNRRQSARRQDRLHGRDENRAQHHARCDDESQKDFARTRRQIAERRLRGCRFRDGGRLRALRNLCQCRPGLLGGLAAHHTTQPARPLRRSVGRARAKNTSR